MELSQLVEQINPIIRSTGNFIVSERIRLESDLYERKKDRSLVTEVDVSAEKRLIEAFQKLIPNSSILGEESGNQDNESEFLWIIDPIDGTTNFVHNFPMYCISVALQHLGKTIYGAVLDCSHQELFYAHHWQEGAYLNETKIEASKVQDLSEALLATGFPTVDFSELDFYINILKDLIKKSHGIRRLGSAALDLAYTACGRCDGFYEYGLNAWDVAAGAYILQKAGGKVTDFNNKGNYLYGRQIIATNHLIHNQLQSFFIKK